MGKFAFKRLSKIIECITPSRKVIVPPTPGYDAGVYEVDKDKYMVVATDPCTGVPEGWFGWLMIHYSASDVALFGARPEMATINLLGPEGTSYRIYKRIMDQACEAAKDLRLDIITGHTGNYPSLSHIVGICTVHGFVEKDKLITPAWSRPGDLILMVKPLGLETLTNFSLTHYKLSMLLFGLESTKRLRSMIPYQTCVNEALLLAGMEGVHAMHDATEGGIVAALNEMADTSKLGFDLTFESLPIREELRRIKDHFKLTLKELLSISSTGSLLVSIAPSRRGEIVDALSRKGFTNKIIGKFTEENERFIQIKGRRRRFPAEARDPYSKIFFFS